MLEENTKKKIDKLATLITTNDDNLTKDRIKKSDFDKTLIGTVIGWEYGNQEIIDGYDDTDDTPITHTEVRVKWIIICNNIEYRVWQTQSDITSIGQQVRLYYPNNDDTNKYAEVMDNSQQTYMYSHPSKCVYNWQNHTITETWALNDGTYIEKQYQLAIRTDQQTGDDEVYRMTMPDGTIIKLEGFFLNRFS